jgi:hypothetical protein
MKCKSNADNTFCYYLDSDKFKTGCPKNCIKKHCPEVWMSIKKEEQFLKFN